MAVVEALHLLGFIAERQGSTLPSVDEIRRAFRLRALQWHPDKHTPSSNSLATPPVQATVAEEDESSAQPHPWSPTRPLDRGVAATSPSAPSTVSAPGPSGSCTQEQAAEHFKRLVNAYQLLLHAAAGNAGGGHAMAARDPGPGAGEALDPDDTDEQLLDELSVDLLLMYAHKLRLSDFDIMFLHQRASGSASGVCAVFPDAAQSLDDLWRRIRRRVERRRKRRQAAVSGAGAHGAGSSSGGPSSAGFKWALLSDFLADVVGAGGPGEAHNSGIPGQPSTGSAAAAAAATGEAVGCGDGVAGGGEEPQLEPDAPRNQAGTTVEPGAAGAAAVPPALHRQRGRLPPGFYWRWFKRLAAARLLFFIFFKS